MIQEDAYDAAVVGVSGIIHLESVMTFSTDPEEVVGPSVQGTLNIFRSAKRETRVQGLVYTSSSTACALPLPDQDITMTKDIFNETAIPAAHKAHPTPFNVYAASKAASEKALWAAVKGTAPPFQVSTVLLDANFGRLLKLGNSSTGSWITDFHSGKDYPFNSPPQFFVDVSDDAKLHVAALIDPTCDGQRIFAFAHAYNWNDILAIFRKLQLDKSFLGDRTQGRVIVDVPNDEAEDLLKKHYGHG